MKYPFDMKEIMKDAIHALKSGKKYVQICDMPFPIRFIHNNSYPQYGVMSPAGEIVRLVMYDLDNVQAYPA